MYRTFLASLVWCALICAVCCGAASAESVDITVPTSVGFNVTDITQSTTGSPNPTAFSYTNADLALGHALRISVKANAPEFTSPGGTTIPASSVSWITSSPVNGAGFNGTLSSASYTVVYQSQINPSSGTVDLAWSIPAQGTGIRAGDHSLSLSWKVESVIP